MPRGRFAFVVPRYGVDSAGGAEVLARGVAERLAASGAEVAVLTTCARDHATWRNYYRPGRETIGGVDVRRFPVDEPRRDEEFASLQGRISRGIPLSREEEERWMAGSVHSAPLYDFIAAARDRYDAFLFIPYLFGTTCRGMRVAPEKSLLVPCLHDEAYARLSLFREMFQAARGIVCNSPPEMELAVRLYGLDPARCAVGGMGFEPRERYRPERFRRRYGIKGPFLLYAGRRETGKNTPLLIEYFSIFRRYNRADLRLLLLGTGEVAVPADARAWIADLGYVAEERKHDAYAACLALCQPSLNESLSIVLMEAWLAGAPGLVHGDCLVTASHCLRSNGGLLFRDYPGFEECLLALLGREGLRGALAAGGRRYVEREYSWEAAMERWGRALARFGLGEP
ncbi:MAG: glycosyltransferase family 4 protein [bacterium]|nr:glycosyltransferase family 4 protein [bacterium]